MKGLAGKRVLITGASSGVGLRAAQRFAAEGATLALLARSADALQELNDESGLDAVLLAVDIADREAVEAAVAEAAARLGGLDIVVSNAAAAVFGHLGEVHADDFDRTVAVTFTGAVNVIRAALPHLRTSRGTIVATGSLMARVPLPTWSSYSAAKHALRGFLNSLAIEEREQRTGVRVAMIHPGPIDTPLFAQASSATTRKPRVVPDAYSADLIARALAAAAIHPRREVCLGGQTRLIDLGFLLVRPVAERVLVLVDRWYRSGPEPAPLPGSLWQPTSRPTPSGGIPSRDSLFAAFQLGPQMRPAQGTVGRALRHGAIAGCRAIQLRGDLVAPVAERPAAATGLECAEDGKPTAQQATV